ncbi:unnamed protein product [Lactuca virosa]|uniref:Transferase, Chloramphenicol acetyltransferase-like domain protein n=1 Tax=Lactuca virosa TaxID=75947 RepID=A0AAU9NDT5_9ASTR|nr:unnamed protein product [Lactuca virosa]
MTMIGNLIRSGRRQLHTIISKEIIKPSSPTPSPLKTHNLSFIDQATISTFVPFVTFYPNTGIYPSSHDITLDLKKSLSQTLTKYYPFAGRFAKVAPSFVDCNDHGAEFLEASIDSSLSDFLKTSQHQDLDQFFPHGLVNQKSNRPNDDHLQSNGVIPLAVQVNHFECGGVAVAMSLSHKIADGNSFVHFLSDWAKMTQLLSSREQKHGLPDDPHFIPYEYMNLNYNGFSLGSDECVTKSFIFPKAKINELKLKVKAMTAEAGQPITDPTRIEVLNWLLYNSAVTAATKNNSGCFKPTGVGQLTNMRSRFMEKLPEKSIGNYFMIMDTLTHNESELKPESFFSELRKQKKMFQGIRDIQTAFGILSGITIKEGQRRFDSVYLSTSLCGYSTYEIDFGWGKPVKATMAGDLRKNSFIMMDAPDGDGIEVLVCLGKQDLAVVQSDPELLAFSN